MSIWKSFATVGGATIASRLLGFVRDTMIASAMGTGPVADAFVVAFRLPNLFRRLFAEGAFNAAFVPLYARALAEREDDAARRFAAEIASVLVVLVTLVSTAAILFAPVLVAGLAAGFGSDATKFGLAVDFTRICFPYLACMSLTGMLGGILAAHRRFLYPALAPVVLNLVLISALGLIVGGGFARSTDAGYLLSGGVAVAGVSQLLLVGFGVWRAGYGFRLRLPRITRSVRQLTALALPGLLAGGVTQINIVIGTTIASLQAGAVSYLYYADRIYQLPLGVVGIAIGTVLLPELVHRIRQDRDDLSLDTLNRCLEFALLLTVPAAIGLMIGAHPIVEVLFERGAFGPRDTSMTADALAGFAAGLPAFVMVKVFAPAFFARLDMRTPMWIGLAAVVVNGLLSCALFASIGHLGIALATTVAGWLNAGLLWLVLSWRGHWRADGALERRLPRMLVAAAGMGLAVWILGRVLEGWLGAENALGLKVAALALLVGGGVGVFAALGVFLGAIDLAAIRGAVDRERRPDKAASFDASFD